MRHIMIAAVLLTVVATAHPAYADLGAGVGFALGSGRVAEAYYESEAMTAEVFAFDDLYVSSDDGAGTPAGGPEVGVCVLIFGDSEDVSDDGCGPVTVEIDPLLRTAHVVGTVKSHAWTAPGQENAVESTINVDLELTGGDALVPTTGFDEGGGVGNYGPLGGAGLFFQLSAGVVRPAIGVMTIASEALHLSVENAAPTDAAILLGSGGLGGLGAERGGEEF